LRLILEDACQRSYLRELVELHFKILRQVCGTAILVFFLFTSKVMTINACKISGDRYREEYWSVSMRPFVTGPLVGSVWHCKAMASKKTGRNYSKV
jgi:hypothetical protein